MVYRVTRACCLVYNGSLCNLYAPLDDLRRFCSYKFVIHYYSGLDYKVVSSDSILPSFK